MKFLPAAMKNETLVKAKADNHGKEKAKPDLQAHYIALKLYPLLKNAAAR